MTEFRDDLTIEQPGDTELVKDLRKQLREQAKAYKALEGEVQSFKAEKRVTTVADALQKKGVNPKVAKLIPDTVEPTEEAVGKWLDEWADALNIQRTEAPAEGGQNAETAAQNASPVTPELQAAYALIRQAEAAGTIVPSLGADQIKAKVSELKGKGSDAVIKELTAQGLINS